MNIRNVAIIAHVDHGKTTLVDSLLRQSKTKLSKENAEREFIMDSNELERERGITIFSKNASVEWRGTKINIIDTPGHADFGGEVERVLSMADGCLLLVDAKEGPMPQTRFVLKQALAKKHRIIVVINKIDRPDARPDFVLNKTFDLFVELGASDAIADFPVIYASAKQGKAGQSPILNSMTDISPIFEAILEYIPAPEANESAPLQMLITTISGDVFKGRIATGRIANGILKANQDVVHISRSGVMKKYRPPSVMTFTGLERIDAKEVRAGDIAAISGIPDITIGETIADPDNPSALPLLKIEEPTVKMNFSVNDSPFCGKEGEFSTSRQIRERLYRELEIDTALLVEDAPNGNWIVSGRGELHLAILIERMRREGYEFQVSRPRVITKETDGKIMTPYEQAFIEVPEAYNGIIIQKLGARHGEIQDMRSEEGITFLEFLIPTQGLLGYRSEFLTDTKGLGILNTIFYGYKEDPGGWKERNQGSLVAHETGVTNMYGLINVQDRGVLFLGPAINVYKGQVVGQNSRSNDLSVNVCKTKELSNMRSRNDAAAEHFNTPRDMDLEDALEYIGDDELVEVTPKTVRIRKMVLDEADEKRKKALGLISR
ncbi:MAG: GTP-binding protein TypA [Candidatus Sungbacteria bacterium RIFCSPLOWO2_12_FULL_41_11]|uniref:50S ribosomal subunit assembly factor BipA n=1 Tax=Candidatus Sungbacteria bacterium RIFCSPLOWO2_12_FULL_41_11 TaxID=1802286 RepID=A0A1G2LR58_9BACT|nr:MAG: GTP-binding protein TypA [Parcubacteria group bacterium GW2011_GWA2_42_14]OHA00215.1 MAG: GTP-binding protein TypA [Candidatus Sungbacteria bacterium RIFCSPHIGHO2_02_FULL_41_12b]OHA14120.1 MAG: GTP-binding protein TypA [Candidatus Sungbacteria bacterium RIFCSPLOWO2_12_FULL_41_11]